MVYYCLSVLVKTYNYLNTGTFWAVESCRLLCGVWSDSMPVLCCYFVDVRGPWKELTSTPFWFAHCLMQLWSVHLDKRGQSTFSGENQSPTERVDPAFLHLDKQRVFANSKDAIAWAYQGFHAVMEYALCLTEAQLLSEWLLNLPAVENSSFVLKLHSWESHH